MPSSSVGVMTVSEYAPWSPAHAVRYAVPPVQTRSIRQHMRDDLRIVAAVKLQPPLRHFLLQFCGIDYIAVVR